VAELAEDDVLAEIRRVVRSELEIERAIEPADDLARDLALDSVGLTVLAVALEDRFRVRLSEADAAGIATVGELAALVARKRAEPSP
jgi:acyl carrier protein